MSMSNLFIAYANLLANKLYYYKKYFSRWTF